MENAMETACRRPRKLTRREKVIASDNGLNPADYLSFGDNGSYLFLMKRDGSECAYIPLDAPEISVTAIARRGGRGG